MTDGPLAQLDARIASGAIEADAAQTAAARRLDRLAGEMARWRPARGWLAAGLRRAKGAAEVPRGLYIHGKVGHGKTMLMDLFYDAVAFRRKRRIHFHEFMAEVHDRLDLARKTVDGDPVPHVAKGLSDAAGLLCFDEFHVTDIADAMILGRLFRGLFEHEVVVVATSNAAPSDLYRGGLNRQLFLPSIALIERHMDVLELVAAKDFRLEKLAGRPLYFTPADQAAHDALSAAFTRLSGVAHGQPVDLDVKGRILRVPEAAHGVARFAFDDLCNRPVGPLDYLHIAHAFHTVFIDGIPRLDASRRNEARRLTALIDTLYDQRVTLIVSAAVEPGEIYPAGDAAFLFERTASRLMEMRSQAYLAARADRAALVVA